MMASSSAQHKVRTNPPPLFPVVVEDAGRAKGAQPTRLGSEPEAGAVAPLFISEATVGISRPRPPRLIWPPLRPAWPASSGVHSWAVPFSCAARPPLLAISRCFSADIDANPRRSLRSVVITARPSVCLLTLPSNHVRTFRVRLRWGILNPRGTRLVERRLRRLVVCVLILFVRRLALRRGRVLLIDVAPVHSHRSPCAY